MAFLPCVLLLTSLFTFCISCTKQTYSILQTLCVIFRLPHHRHFEVFTSALWFTDSNLGLKSVPPPTLADFRVQRVRWTVTSKRRHVPCESSVIVYLSRNSSTRWVIPRLRASLNQFPRAALCSYLRIESTTAWSWKINTCGSLQSRNVPSWSQVNYLH